MFWLINKKEAYTSKVKGRTEVSYIICYFQKGEAAYLLSKFHFLNPKFSYFRSKIVIRFFSSFPDYKMEVSMCSDMGWNQRKMKWRKININTRNIFLFLYCYLKYLSASKMKIFNQNHDNIWIIFCSCCQMVRTVFLRYKWCLYGYLT